MDAADVEWSAPGPVRVVSAVIYRVDPSPCQRCGRADDHVEADHAYEFVPGEEPVWVEF